MSILIRTVNISYRIENEKFKYEWNGGDKEYPFLFSRNKISRLQSNY